MSSVSVYICQYIYVKIRIKYRKMPLFLSFFFSFVKLRQESWSVFSDIGKMGFSNVQYTSRKAERIIKGSNS